MRILGSLRGFWPHICAYNPSIIRVTVVVFNSGKLEPSISRIVNTLEHTLSPWSGAFKACFRTRRLEGEPSQASQVVSIRLLDASHRVQTTSRVQILTDRTLGKTSSSLTSRLITAMETVETLDAFNTRGKLCVQCAAPSDCGASEQLTSFHSSTLIHTCARWVWKYSNSIPFSGHPV